MRAGVSRSGHSILSKTLAHNLCKLSGVERFGEKVDAFLQFKVLARHFGAVSAGDDDFQVRIVLPELLCQIGAADAIGHHHIG